MNNSFVLTKATMSTQQSANRIFSFDLHLFHCNSFSLSQFLTRAQTVVNNCELHYYSLVINVIDVAIITFIMFFFNYLVTFFFLI